MQMAMVMRVSLKKVGKQEEEVEDNRSRRKERDMYSIFCIIFLINLF